MSPSSEVERWKMQKSYQKLIGELTYLTNATHPDIVFAASLLNRFSTNPEKSNISN